MNEMSRDGDMRSSKMFYKPKQPSTCKRTSSIITTTTDHLVNALENRLGEGQKVRINCGDNPLSRRETDWRKRCGG